MEFIVDIAPGLLAINRAYAAMAFYDKAEGRWRGRLYTNKTFEDAKALMRAHLRREHRGGPMPGRLRVEVTTYWPQLNRKLGIDDIAKGDVDAVGKAILDCLEDAGVIVNDAQVVELELRKEPAYRSAPRIEIWVGEPRGPSPQKEMFDAV